MANRHYLTNELSWGAIGRLEASQIQVEITRWLNINKTVVHRLETV